MRALYFQGTSKIITRIKQLRYGQVLGPTDVRVVRPQQPYTLIMDNSYGSQEGLEVNVIEQGAEEESKPKAKEKAKVKASAKSRSLTGSYVSSSSSSSPIPSSTSSSSTSTQLPLHAVPKTIRRALAVQGFAAGGYGLPTLTSTSTSSTDDDHGFELIPGPVPGVNQSPPTVKQMDYLATLLLRLQLTPEQVEEQLAQIQTKAQASHAIDLLLLEQQR